MLARNMCKGLGSTCQEKGGPRPFKKITLTRQIHKSCKRRKLPRQQIFFPNPKQNYPKLPATHFHSPYPRLPTNFPPLSNAPINQNPPPILLPPPPPPMASRLCFNLGKPKLFTAQIRKPFFSASSLPSSAPGVHSVQFGATNLSIRRRLLVISPQATSEQSGFASPPLKNCDQI